MTDKSFDCTSADMYILGVGICAIGNLIQKSPAGRFVALPFCLSSMAVITADLVIATVANIFVLGKDLFSGQCTDFLIDVAALCLRPIVGALLLGIVAAAMPVVMVIALISPDLIFDHFK